MLGGEEGAADVECLCEESVTNIKQHARRGISDHLVPPKLLIDILDGLFRFENRRVIHQHISMSILLLHLIEQRCDRCWIGNIGRHNKSLDIWMRLGHSVGDSLQLVCAAGDKNDGFRAGSREGRHKGLGTETLAGASDDDDFICLWQRDGIDCGVDVAVSSWSELHGLDEVVDGEVVHGGGWR